MLKRLNASGLTVNEAKCELSKDRLNFFGINFSKEVVSVDKKKHDALIDAKSPTTICEIRILLGLASYCSRFIPDFATIVEPLRELTKKNVQWHWGTHQQKALDKLKKAVSTNAMNYFEPKLRSEQTVDASPVGLGVVMEQYDPANQQDKRLVMFAGRALSKC